MIGIIDYGSGNVAAFANVYSNLNIDFCVSSDLKLLSQADRFILPGVGAFDATMRSLLQTGIAEFLSTQVHDLKKKLLGVCVGMQVLSERSDEGMLPGFGWIQGEVRRIEGGGNGPPPRLPHMGWNSVRVDRECRLFDDVNQSEGFYFLHSYALKTESTAPCAWVHYGEELVCAIQRDNIYAVQFHPEKSHSNGIQLLSNFAVM
jgi:glutamine amidotransferase